MKKPILIAAPLAGIFALAAPAHAEQAGNPGAPTGYVLCKDGVAIPFEVVNGGFGAAKAREECDLRHGGVAAGIRANPVGPTGVKGAIVTAVPRSDLAVPRSDLVAPPSPTPDQGRPNEDGDAVKGIAVLNCSRSANNPASANLSTGQPGWSVTLPGGAPSSVVPAANVAWSAVPGASWVGPAGAPVTIGIYTYSTKIRINACPNGEAAKIVVNYRADNIGTLLIDGVVVQNQAGTPNYGFLPASLTSKTHQFPAGTNGVHTVTLQVQNSGSVTGLAASVMASR